MRPEGSGHAYLLFLTYILLLLLLLLLFLLSIEITIVGVIIVAIIHCFNQVVNQVGYDNTSLRYIITPE